MRSISYVGITGFERGKQAEVVRSSISTDRLLMIGACMRGDPTEWNPDRWPNRNPRPEILQSIFRPHRNVLNILHFTPLPGCDLYEHLCKAQEVAGPHCDGFQLNTPWPDIQALARYKSSSQFRSKVITITAQPDALETVGWDPKRVAQNLKEYEAVADYVLVDPSAGHGKELDVLFTRQCLEAIAALMPNVGLVVASGFDAYNVESKIASLLADFPLSTDAEGKLRTADDHLDLKKAVAYAKATEKLLQKYDTLRK